MSAGIYSRIDIMSPNFPCHRILRTAPPIWIAPRTAIANRTRTFFKAANQLPLLAVAGMSVSDPATPYLVAPNAADPSHITARALTAQTYGFLNLRKTNNDYAYKTVPTRKLTVIAFQDPDDLLGFRASDGVTQDSDHDFKIVDVLHRNTPQIAFSLAWPQNAHDHEMVDLNSRRMILCGADAAASGKLRANRCPDGPQP